MVNTRPSRPMRALGATSQWVNIVFLRGEDETISARCHREKRVKLEKFIDKIFRDPSHCRDSHLAELYRARTLAKRFSNEP
jgi:hypothetical protein